MPVRGPGRPAGRRGQPPGARGRTARARARTGAAPPVTVDADQLENLQKEGLVVFTGNVVARQNNSSQYADRMEVYLDEKGDRIVRTVSTGNVRIITKDCRTGTAQRAEYYDARAARGAHRQRAGVAGRQRGDRRAHHDLPRRGPQRGARAASRSA